MFGITTPFPYIAGNATRRACACGTDIVCISDEEGVAIGVAAHQQTPEHQAYRARMGYPPKLPRTSYPATAAGQPAVNAGRTHQ